MPSPGTSPVYSTARASNIERQFCGQRDVVLRCCTSLPFCDVGRRYVTSQEARPAKLASRLAEAFPKADLPDGPSSPARRRRWRAVFWRGAALTMLRKRLAPDARARRPRRALRAPAPSRSSHKAEGRVPDMCRADESRPARRLLDKQLKGAYQRT